MFADSGSQICSGCPHNALEITRNDGLADAVEQIAGASGTGAAIDAAMLPIPLAARRIFEDMGRVGIHRADFRIAVLD